MQVNEETMRFLEEHIPEMADSAAKLAYWQALTSGSSVLECEDGVLYERFPNGERKIRKQLKPPTRVTIGQKFIIR